MPEYGEIDPAEARRVQREIAKEVASEVYRQVWYSLAIPGHNTTVLVYAGYSKEAVDALTHIDNLRALSKSSDVIMITVMLETGAFEGIWKIEQRPPASL